ncbi:MAG: hypothetical protein J5687_05095 [Treponema sp.]|nr:hypothetical protein [Treponema sp.]
MNHKNEWMYSLFTEVADCSISISKSITQKEWKTIYKEVLALAKKLDFCYVKHFNYDGVKGQCLARSVEVSEDYYGTISPKLKLEGIYSQRVAVVPFSISKRLKKDSCEQETGSAFLGYAYDDYSLASEISGYELENQTYIRNILAIAFFIESMLPEKIFVNGSFPYEYVIEAVNTINQYLKKPIGLPLVCRAKDLVQQIQQTNFSDKEKFELFCKTYMGKLDEECWKVLYDSFPSDIIQKNLKNSKNENDEETQESHKKISEDEDKKIETDEDNIDEHYDIEWTTQLFDFKKGDSIDPDLLENILTVLNNIEPAKKQKGYEGLSQNSPIDQIRKLAAYKNGLALLDTDWKHIIYCFKTKKNALERYYPLFMVSCDSYELTSNITRALMVNDALYKYCTSIYKKQQKNKEIIQEDL